MDDRFFFTRIGKPVPTWDLQHRLSINGVVGPEIMDSGTVFRSNSVYMDISDQPHMMRQWLAGGTLAALFSAGMFFYGLIYILHSYKPKIWDAMDFFFISQLAFASIFFFFLTIWTGRGEFFSLTIRPIRFNRNTQKIYAIREKRFLNYNIEGDIIWELPWDNSSIFCVHKGPAKFDLDEHYHIRCYQLDDAGNVLRGFSIGREWEGKGGLRELLAQWNYWCFYMNKGPSELPKPLLYLSEFENTAESFLYCLYEIGFNLPAAIRAMFMPFILLLTSHRLMSLWTCRQPVWPDSILDLSQVPRDDPYDQPSGDTPIGWAETSRARREGSYPKFPSSKTENWTGEPNPIKNALLWQKDVAPGNKPIQVTGSARPSSEGEPHEEQQGKRSDQAGRLYLARRQGNLSMQRLQGARKGHRRQR